VVKEESEIINKGDIMEQPSFGENICSLADKLIYDTLESLVEHEVLSELIASTNASGWEKSCDCIEYDKIVVKIPFHAQFQGDNDEDRAFNGDTINSKGYIVINGNGELVSLEFNGEKEDVRDGANNCEFYCKPCERKEDGNAESL
jgi:hypothetical protein